MADSEKSQEEQNPAAGDVKKSDSASPKKKQRKGRSPKRAEEILPESGEKKEVAIESKKDNLSVEEKPRGRSPSPIYIPGSSASYAEVVIGQQEGFDPFKPFDDKAEAVKLKIHQKQMKPDELPSAQPILSDFATGDKNLFYSPDVFIPGQMIQGFSMPPQLYGMELAFDPLNNFSVASETEAAINQMKIGLEGATKVLGQPFLLQGLPAKDEFPSDWVPQSFVSPRTNPTQSEPNKPLDDKKSDILTPSNKNAKEAKKNPDGKQGKKDQKGNAQANAKPQQQAPPEQGDAPGSEGKKNKKKNKNKKAKEGELEKAAGDVKPSAAPIIETLDKPAEQQKPQEQPPQQNQNNTDGQSKKNKKKKNKNKQPGDAEASKPQDGPVLVQLPAEKPEFKDQKPDPLPQEQNAPEQGESKSKKKKNKQKKGKPEALNADEKEVKVEPPKEPKPKPAEGPKPKEKKPKEEPKKGDASKKDQKPVNLPKPPPTLIAESVKIFQEEPESGKRQKKKKGNQNQEQKKGINDALLSVSTNQEKNRSRSRSRDIQKVSVRGDIIPLEDIEKMEKLAEEKRAKAKEAREAKEKLQKEAKLAAQAQAKAAKPMEKVEESKQKAAGKTDAKDSKKEEKPVEVKKESDGDVKVVAEPAKTEEQPKKEEKPKDGKKQQGKQKKDEPKGKKPEELKKEVTPTDPAKEEAKAHEPVKVAEPPKVAPVETKPDDKVIVQQEEKEVGKPAGDKKQDTKNKGQKEPKPKSVEKPDEKKDEAVKQPEKKLEELKEAAKPVPEPVPKAAEVKVPEKKVKETKDDRKLKGEENKEVAKPVAEPVPKTADLKEPEKKVEAKVDKTQTSEEKKEVAKPMPEPVSKAGEAKQPEKKVEEAKDDKKPQPVKVEQKGEEKSKTEQPTDKNQQYKKKGQKTTISHAEKPAPEPEKVEIIRSVTVTEEKPAAIAPKKTDKPDVPLKPEAAKWGKEKQDISEKSEILPQSPLTKSEKETWNEKAKEPEKPKKDQKSEVAPKSTEKEAAAGSEAPKTAEAPTKIADVQKLKEMAKVTVEQKETDKSVKPEEKSSPEPPKDDKGGKGKKDQKQPEKKQSEQKQAEEKQKGESKADAVKQPEAPADKVEQKSNEEKPDKSKKPAVPPKPTEKKQRESKKSESEKAANQKATEVAGSGDKAQSEITAMPTETEKKAQKPDEKSQGKIEERKEVKSTAVSKIPPKEESKKDEKTAEKAQEKKQEAKLAAADKVPAKQEQKKEEIKKDEPKVDTPPKPDEKSGKGDATLETKSGIKAVEKPEAIQEKVEKKDPASQGEKPPAKKPEVPEKPGQQPHGKKNEKKEQQKGKQQGKAAAEKPIGPSGSKEKIGDAATKPIASEPIVSKELAKETEKSPPKPADDSQQPKEAALSKKRDSVPQIQVIAGTILSSEPQKVVGCQQEPPTPQKGDESQHPKEASLSKKRDSLPQIQVIAGTVLSSEPQKVVGCQQEPPTPQKGDESQQPKEASVAKKRDSLPQIQVISGTALSSEPQKLVACQEISTTSQRSESKPAEPSKTAETKKETEKPVTQAAEQARENQSRQSKKGKGDKSRTTSESSPSVINRKQDDSKQKPKQDKQSPRQQQKKVEAPKEDKPPAEAQGQVKPEQKKEEKHSTKKEPVLLKEEKPLELPKLAEPGNVQAKEPIKEVGAQGSKKDSGDAPLIPPADRPRLVEPQKETKNQETSSKPEELKKDSPKAEQPGKTPTIETVKLEPEKIKPTETSKPPEPKKDEKQVTPPKPFDLKLTETSSSWLSLLDEDTITLPDDDEDEPPAPPPVPVKKDPPVKPSPEVKDTLKKSDDSWDTESTPIKRRDTKKKIALPNLPQADLPEAKPDPTETVERRLSVSEIVKKIETESKSETSLEETPTTKKEEGTVETFTEEAGIFGSVKERHRGPRKIVDISPKEKEAMRELSLKPDNLESKPDQKPVSAIPQPVSKVETAPEKLWPEYTVYQDAEKAWQQQKAQEEKPEVAAKSPDSVPAAGQISSQKAPEKKPESVTKTTERVPVVPQKPIEKKQETVAKPPDTIPAAPQKAPEKKQESVSKTPESIPAAPTQLPANKQEDVVKPANDIPIGPQAALQKPQQKKQESVAKPSEIVPAAPPEKKQESVAKRPEIVPAAPLKAPEKKQESVAKPSIIVPAAPPEKKQESVAKAKETILAAPPKVPERKQEAKPAVAVPIAPQTPLQKPESAATVSDSIPAAPQKSLESTPKPTESTSGATLSTPLEDLQNVIKKLDQNVQSWESVTKTGLALESEVASATQKVEHLLDVSINVESAPTINVDQAAPSTESKDQSKDDGWLKAPGNKKGRSRSKSKGKNKQEAKEQLVTLQIDTEAGRARSRSRSRGPDVPKVSIRGDIIPLEELKKIEEKEAERLKKKEEEKKIKAAAEEEKKAIAAAEKERTKAAVEAAKKELEKCDPVPIPAKTEPEVKKQEEKDKSLKPEPDSKKQQQSKGKDKVEPPKKPDSKPTEKAPEAKKTEEKSQAKAHSPEKAKPESKKPDQKTPQQSPKKRTKSETEAKKPEPKPADKGQQQKGVKTGAKPVDKSQSQPVVSEKLATDTKKAAEEIPHVEKSAEESKTEQKDSTAPKSEAEVKKAEIKPTQVKENKTEQKDRSQTEQVETKPADKAKPSEVKKGQPQPGQKRTKSESESKTSQPKPADKPQDKKDEHKPVQEVKVESKQADKPHETTVKLEPEVKIIDIKPSEKTRPAIPPRPVKTPVELKKSEQKNQISEKESEEIKQVPEVQKSDAKVPEKELKSSDKKPVEAERKESESSEAQNLPTNLTLDRGFWPDRWQYVDAEDAFRGLQRSKEETPPESEAKSDKKDKDDDKDKGGDGSSKSGKPPSDSKPTGPQPDKSKETDSSKTEKISFPLSGGVGGWTAENTYLANSNDITPVPTLFNSNTIENVEKMNLLGEEAREVSQISYEEPPCVEEPEEQITKPEGNTFAMIAKDVLVDLKQRSKEIEESLKSLPGDNLEDMAAALENIITDLKSKETIALDLEKSVQKLPPDEETDTLLNDLTEIKAKIVSLLSQANLGQEQVMNAQGTLRRQQTEIKKFESMVYNMERWLESARPILLREVDGSDITAIQLSIQAHENLYKELLARSDELNQLSRQLTGYRKEPELTSLCETLEPRVSHLQQSFSELEKSLKDRLKSLQEIHSATGHRMQGEQAVVESKSIPEASPSHKFVSPPSPTNVGDISPICSNEEPPCVTDGLPTNVCRVEETLVTSSTLPENIPLITPPQPEKAPIVTAESLEDSVKSEVSVKVEEAPENEYSAKQVSQKVFDYLEIDEPESLSYRDDTIDSRASPIPNEEVIDLNSPRFEYYEEIKFKKPVLFGQSAEIREQEIDETTQPLPDVEEWRLEKGLLTKESQTGVSLMENYSGKRILVSESTITTRDVSVECNPPKIASIQTSFEKTSEETTKPEMVTVAEMIEGIPESTLSQLTEQLNKESNEGSVTSVIRIQQRNRRIVTKTRKIIRKTVIVNGVETVTEEIVEEPEAFDSLEISEPEIVDVRLIHDEESDLLPSSQSSVVVTTSEVKKGVVIHEPNKGESALDSKILEESVTSTIYEDSLSPRIPAKPGSEDSVETSLAESTDIIIGSDGDKTSSDTTKPTNFELVMGHTSEIICNGKEGKAESDVDESPKQEVAIFESEGYISENPDLKLSERTGTDVEEKIEIAESVTRDFTPDSLILSDVRLDSPQKSTESGYQPEEKTSTGDMTTTPKEEEEWKKGKPQKRKKKKKRDERGYEGVVPGDVKTPEKVEERKLGSTESKRDIVRKEAKAEKCAVRIDVAEPKQSSFEEVEKIVVQENIPKQKREAEKPEGDIIVQQDVSVRKQEGGKSELDTIGQKAGERIMMPVQKSEEKGSVPDEAKKKSSALVHGLNAKQNGDEKLQEVEVKKVLKADEGAKGIDVKNAASEKIKDISVEEITEIVIKPVAVENVEEISVKQVVVEEFIGKPTAIEKTVENVEEVVIEENVAGKTEEISVKPTEVIEEIVGKPVTAEKIEEIIEQQIAVEKVPEKQVEDIVEKPAAFKKIDKVITVKEVDEKPAAVEKTKEIIEKSVPVDEIVEKPAAVEEIGEKLSAVEEIVEKPAAVKAIAEKPAAVKAIAKKLAAVEAIVEKPAEKEAIVEKPAADEGIVEKPAPVVKTVEKPAAVEAIVEKPTIVEKMAEKRVAVKKTEKAVEKTLAVEENVKKPVPVAPIAEKLQKESPITIATSFTSPDQQKDEHDSLSAQPKTDTQPIENQSPVIKSNGHDICVHNDPCISHPPIEPSETETSQHGVVSAPVDIIKEEEPNKLKEEQSNKVATAGKEVEKLHVETLNTTEKVVLELEDQSMPVEVHEIVTDLLQTQKDSLETPEKISVYMQTSPPPALIDLSMQTSSPEITPREDVKTVNKISQTKDYDSIEESMQTEFAGIDTQSQTNGVVSLPSQTTQTTVREEIDKSQQTSKVQSPVEKDTADVFSQTQQQLPLSDADKNTQTVFASVDTSSQTKKKSTEEKERISTSESPDSKSDKEEGQKKTEHVKLQGSSSDEPFEVHVKAKVTLSSSALEPSESRSKKSDKKDRKRKLREERSKQEEDKKVIEVSSHISVDKGSVQIDTNVKAPEDGADPKVNVDVTGKTDDKRVEPSKAQVTVDVRQKDFSLKRSHSKTDGNEKENLNINLNVSSEESSDKQTTPEGIAEIGTNIPTPPLIGDHSPGPPSEDEKLSDKILVTPDELNKQWQKATNLTRDRVKNLQNAKKASPLNNIMLMPGEAASEPIENKIQTIESNVETIRDAVGRMEIVVIQQTIIQTVEIISDWLETIEYRILLNRRNTDPSQEKVNELNSLKDEIRTVKENLRKLSNAVDDAKNCCSGEDSERIRNCIESLESQIKEIQEVANVEQESAAKDLSRWEEFLNGVNNISVLVEEVRQQLESVVESESSTRSKLEELEKIESANKTHMGTTLKLIQLAKLLLKEFPNQEIPSETYTTHELTRLIENNVIIERERLLQLLSLADEYEQTLKEFAQIIEVADNLVDGPININSLQHLQDEMQKHRKFFVNLSHCRGILESLEGNLDEETRSLHSELHSRLHEKASSILDKAAGRSQQMAMAASRWTVLEQGVKEEQQWLQVAHQRLPDLNQVMSSDYDQYISLYQSLASDVAIHHAKITQLMGVANKLQDIITCVGLESFYDDYLDVVLKIQDEVRVNLERLLAFQETWTLCEIMTDKLDAWMKTAEDDLKNITKVTARGNMRQFWELKAQFEVHNHLREEAGNHFENAVRLLPIADEMLQRQFYGQIQDRWRKIEKEMNDIQSSATANLSSQDVSVNDKLKLLEDELNELNDTVDDLHGIIKNDEELNLYIERLQILSGRLETIQEELGRLGLLPAAESEKVGCLLSLGRRLEHQLAEEMDGSIVLREKLSSLQKGLQKVRRNQASASSTLDQCEAAETMGSEVVEQALKNCQHLADDLSEQWQEIMMLRQVLHTLPMRLRLSVSPIKVEREISQLQEVHTVLEERCANLTFLLRNRLGLWRRFERQLELVQQNVQETDYMMELLTIQGSIDYERLRRATERLEDLHDSMGQREDLVIDLKTAAEPLATTCTPEVAAQINSAVDEAVTAWNDTCQNLNELHNKYKDAVKLWKQYKDASDDMKKWVDQQMGSLESLDSTPEGVVQVQACEEILTAHKARLDELKSLVAQIAADVGLEAGGLLECEVEALGKRLEDVRETLTTLTNVAEERTQQRGSCKEELIQAKNFLGSVQKSLNALGENGDGNTLSTLKNHLLALGKTESQVHSMKEKSIEMNDKPHEIRNETSVIEILELWQQVFRETFQQYHRLSARLVKSQDSAAALQLWQENLLQVQTFLAGTLPEDYDGLCEFQRLCEVHQNCLTSQHSVLLSRKDSPPQDFSRSVQEQFNSLANLHNETLSRIMERHNEVNKRLQLWDAYRRDQSRLLNWLRDMTREQSRLQLRYIHLRRIPKLSEQIEMILAKVPHGKSQARELEKQQESIVKFCDEALATSIKMESVAINERISNLEAGLKSWKDFLDRVKELQKTFDSEIDKVERICDEITEKISQPCPVAFSAAQSRLDNCRDLRLRTSNLIKNIQEAGITYDQLKECLSPHDVKTLHQRLWLLTQRQLDLEHQLLVQIHLLEDRLELQQVFNARHERFMSWAKELIRRFERNVFGEAGASSRLIDSEIRAKRLETEILAEVNLKSREYNWLQAMAKNIIDATLESSHDLYNVPTDRNRVDFEILSADIESKINEMEQVWEKLNNLASLRLEKKIKVTSAMDGLWKRMDDVKLWLQETEVKLETPVIFEKSSKKFVDKLLKDHELIQKNIEQQSGNVGEVLNLCELLLNDSSVETAGVDTHEFETAVRSLEKRWKQICISSAKRKRRILGAWELLQQLAKLCKEHEAWIAEREKILQDLSLHADHPKLNEIQNVAKRLEKERNEIESRAPALKILDASYSKLAQDSRLPPDNIKQIAGPAKVVIGRWHDLIKKSEDISSKLSKVTKLRDDFIKSHNNSIIILTNISARMTQIELLPDARERLLKLEQLEKELNKESSCLKTADEIGLELMTTCTENQDVSATQVMVDEYQHLWKDLKDRFAELRSKSIVESKEIQVSTLKFETDSQVQVDTLPNMERRGTLTSRDAYGFELDVALRECDQHLRGLENILASPAPEPGRITTTHQALAKIIATCTSSVELVQHLNQTLLEHCGMSPIEARSAQVDDISLRFQELLVQARERERQIRDANERGRLTCPLCSRRNWQQLDNDLWRLEQWIQYAEAIQANRSPPPSNIEALEDVIQDHRELLLDLDSHKSIVVSLNIVGEHLADHAEDVENARVLRERLHGLNRRWDHICHMAAQWQGKLQEALMDNEEFHDTIDQLVKWIENTESVIRHSEPVDLSQDEILIQAQYRKFKELGNELDRCEPRVQSLQEAAVQLLERGGLARERLNALRLRLTGLKRLVKVYVLRLGAVLGRDPNEPLDQSLVCLSREMLNSADSVSEVASSSTTHINGDDDVDTTVLRRGCRFLGRVIRASIPIQALMLLLLGAATLVQEEDYNCAFSNNARFQPYYPNGPPPI